MKVYYDKDANLKKHARSGLGSSFEGHAHANPGERKTPVQEPVVGARRLVDLVGVPRVAARRGHDTHS